MKYKRKLTMLFASLSAAALAFAATIVPAGSVSGNVSDGQPVTFVRAGYCEAGTAWTEATLWKDEVYPHDQVLGHVYYSSNPQTITGGEADGTQDVYPTLGPGNYTIQYRLVDTNEDYVDQWISFTVSPLGD